MLKSKGLTKQPTMSLNLSKQYKIIINTKNKKAIRYIGKQGELLKNPKILKTFLTIWVKADPGYILKFHFVSF